MREYERESEGDGEDTRSGSSPLQVSALVPGRRDGGYSVGTEILPVTTAMDIRALVGC